MGSEKEESGRERGAICAKKQGQLHYKRICNFPFLKIQYLDIQTSRLFTKSAPPFLFLTSPSRQKSSFPTPQRQLETTALSSRPPPPPLPPLPSLPPTPPAQSVTELPEGSAEAVSLPSVPTVDTHTLYCVHGNQALWCVVAWKVHAAIDEFG